jgi:hypothetical protein
MGSNALFCPRIRRTKLRRDANVLFPDLESAHQNKFQTFVFFYVTTEPTLVDLCFWPIFNSLLMKYKNNEHNAKR